MKNKILFILFALLTVISCRKDDINDGVINQPPAPSVIYEIDLIGSVVDRNGNALADVQISSGEKSVFTDVNGLFKMNDLSVDGLSGTYLSAEAEGYFSGGNRLYTGGIYSKQVEITLIEKELSGYVNSTKDETISLAGGLNLDFPAGGFTSNGSDYEGLVSIYAYHLDPSQDGFMDLSPGDLSGTDASNNNYILESFGMIAVEMETADGQPVQLKEGSFSTITVPVDASLLQDAPSELPLWHFDEELHKWVKEGTAELINGSYVGQVPHFSWWNCDDFADAADLCVQIFDARFIGSLAGMSVQLTTNVTGTSSSLTDSEGNASGLVPANELIDVVVYDLCGNIAFEGTIGPFTGSGNKEIIPVVLANLDSYNLTGTIYDCEAMEFLANAIVKTQIDGNIYYTETDANGVYALTVLACNDNENYGITAYSIDDGVSGFASGILTISGLNVLDINLCNEAQFLIINGEIVEDVEVVAKRKPNETIIYTDLQNYHIGFYGFTVGTYPAFFIGGQYTSSNSTVTITQFDDVGGVIKGTIQGVDDANQGLVIQGSFVAIIVE